MSTDEGPSRSTPGSASAPREPLPGGEPSPSDDDTTVVPQGPRTRPSQPQHHDEVPDHDVRGVLAIKPFRQLWLSLGLSSFGDWLGLLATTAMAGALGAQSGYAQANLAVSGVLILRLAPAIVFGPLAGVVADRLDRKINMVVGDILRCLLFASIAVVGELWWLFVATVLIEIVGLFWMPAKDATVPNLVPARRLEAANQLSLATTYGSAPFAALLFTGLALVSGVLNNVIGTVGGPIDLALYFNAITYLVAAMVIWNLEMPRRPVAQDGGPVAPVSVWHTLTDGFSFIGKTPLIRGLVLGMLGAFGAGGFVIGVATTFTADLGAGPAGYGVLFGCVFTGLAVGMWVGPRLLADLPRWRLFGLSIVTAGIFLAFVALIPNIVLAALFTVGLGAGAGVAWVTGYTMLGLEVADELRGRTFAFVQSAARVVLVAVMAFAPALAALIGTHTFRITPSVALSYNGAAFTLMFAALLAVGIGVLAYRQMDDHSGVPLVEDVVNAWRRRHIAQPHAMRRPDHPGFFLALEGGDGAGKSTQVRMLEQWLATELGHQVVVTREPGATPPGARIRELLLHGEPIAPRAEALLFAADRAHHVEAVVRPALARGAVVVTDRYIDSSIAYQGAGRALDAQEVEQLSRWATEGLVPDLTVLLDVDPDEARRRRHDSADHTGDDRVESEPGAFHQRVRRHFLDLARRHPRRYLVVDASRSAEEIQDEVRKRLEPVLPLSPQQVAAAEEQARVEAEALAREQEEERARLEMEERARRASDERARRLAAARAREEADERARQEGRVPPADDEPPRASAAGGAAAPYTPSTAAGPGEVRGRGDRDSPDRDDPDRDGAGQGGADQRGADQRGADQRGADQRGADQRGADRDRAEEQARRAAEHRERMRLEGEKKARELSRGRQGEPRTQAVPVDDPPTKELDLTDEIFKLGEDRGR